MKMTCCWKRETTALSLCYVSKYIVTNARNSASMKTLSGRTGVGCAEVPSPEELDALKAAAAKAQEASLRLVDKRE